MSAVFISDLHLSPERPEATAAFVSFCESLRIDQTERLYILGDLFEAWIGDDDDTEFAEQVVSTLLALRQVGIKVFFQRGNRDFLLGNGFAKRSGATLLPDYYLAYERGKKLLLTHGDLLCTDDHDYQRFRRRVQNPVNRWLLARMPIGWRRKLAQRWRQKSARANSNKPENIMDVNSDAVRAALEKYQVTTLIHGHTHRPFRHELQVNEVPAQRLVLGDWGELLWWIRADTEGLALENAKIGDFG
jgi:UDP-2,3-diacylglucosamine hydrolase